MAATLAKKASFRLVLRTSDAELDTNGP